MGIVWYYIFVVEVSRGTFWFFFFLTGLLAAWFCGLETSTLQSSVLRETFQGHFREGSAGV